MLTITVCYRAGIFALIWQMRKSRQETQVRKMTLPWTSMDSQPHPEKLGFYFSTPAMILTQVCKIHHPPSSLPLSPVHSWGGRCWAGCYLAGCLSAQSWCSTFQGPRWVLPTEPHSFFKSSSRQYAALQIQETMQMCSVPSGEGLWRRAQLTHHIRQRPASRLWSWTQAHMRSHTVPKPSNNVNFLCSVAFMIHLNCLNLYR